MNNWEDISALADDQLEGSRAAEMQRQMETDPALRSQYEAILSLKRSLRNDLPDHDSPQTLSLCLDRIREVVPDAKLVYNNSPSFNWTLNFRQQVYDRWAR